MCYAGSVYAAGDRGASARGAGSKLTLMRQTVTFTELGPAEFRSAISGFIAAVYTAINPLMADRNSAGPSSVNVTVGLIRASLLPVPRAGAPSAVRLFRSNRSE